MKKCKRCNQEKEFHNFHKSSKYEDGLVIYCKDCRKKDGINYRENNKEKISNRKQEYKKKNIDKVKETNRVSGKKYKLKNKEKIKIQSKFYREKNSEKLKIARKFYKEKNKDKIIEYNTQNSERIKNYKKNYYSSNKEKISNTLKSKYHSDPLFKLKHLVRNRISKFLKTKNWSKNSRTFEMIGCSPADLKLYLEGKFLEGMMWENHGKWHIDHIIPLSSAETGKEVYQLSHYTNLQPLWSEDNLKKNNKLNYLL